MGVSGGTTEVRHPLLSELLVEARAITPEQLAEVQSQASDALSDGALAQALLERGWITEAQLTQTRSLQLTVPWVSLYHIDISQQLLTRVPYEVADKHCLIPIFIRYVKGQGETLYVAMDDPTNIEALAEVSFHAHLPARPMIASASDIRSAIRIYYAEGAQSFEATSSAGVSRAEPSIPATTRDAPRPPPAPPAAPPVPPLPVPPVPPSNPEDIEPPPPTTRSNPPASARATVLAAASAERATASAERVTAPVPRAEGSEPRRNQRKMVSLTLLDGTTVQLPKARSTRPSDNLTARDFVSALRASAHGADATEILGEQQRWEPVIAALLSILLRKGLIADWEFIDELRKI